MCAVRDVSSYKFACSNEKVVCSGPNIKWLNSENTYQLPWRLLTTLICFQALGEFNK